MDLNINGLKVSVGEEAVSELVRERLARESAPLIFGSALASYGSLPRIGAAYQNGIYAGLARGLDGAADYPLLVGPEAPERLTWTQAGEFAASNKGWRLMLRHEAWLCKANVPELFKAEYYWTGAQCEGCDGFAWAQGFGSGVQHGCRKSNDCRGRLVRSVIVID